MDYYFYVLLFLLISHERRDIDRMNLNHSRNRFRSSVNSSNIFSSGNEVPDEPLPPVNNYFDDSEDDEASRLRHDEGKQPINPEVEDEEDPLESFM